MIHRTKAENRGRALCEKLKDTNTLVIVTADHGHINSKDITLSDYKDIFRFVNKFCLLF